VSQGVSLGVCRRAQFVIFASGLVLATLGTAPALGQQSGTEDRADEVEGKIETRREVQRTADEALELDGFGDGPRVTYQQVLADPDNIDLNFGMP